MRGGHEPAEVVAGANTTGVAARFPCFDGLRAVAALSVVAFHFFSVGDPGQLHGAAQLWVSRLGSQGVGIFFVISGFLLYRPFVEAALRGDVAPSTAEFFRRRFARIFPAYWLALTAYVYVFGFSHIHGAANFVTYYGLLQNYRGGYAFAGLAVAWTLVIELSFYIALPMISRMARSIAGENPDDRRVLRVQLGVVGSLAALGLLSRAFNLVVLTKETPALGAWFPVQAFGWSLFGFLDWFAAGMAMAIVVVWAAHTNSTPKPVAVLSRYPGICWLVALGLYATQAHLHLDRDPGSSAATPLATFMVSVLVVLTATLLVFPAVFGPQDRGAVRSFLRSPPMGYLGRISYGIYLWHYAFVLQSLRWVSDGALPSVFVVRFAFVVLLTVGVAAASYHFLEAPIISWAHRRAPRAPELTDTRAGVRS